MPLTLAYVTPEVLRWARETSGYTLKDAAHELGVDSWRLELAEQGDELLTLRQAEQAADLYERDLAELFMAEPPEEAEPEQQFRMLPGSPQLPWPREMRLLARRIRERQDAAAELYEVLEEDPPWRTAARRFRIANLPVLPQVTRDVLGISREEQESWHDGYAPLRAWRGAIEQQGVLVMQDGALPVPAMRGFASLHPDVPAIVANNKDDPRARAFTIVHEFAHLLRDLHGLENGPATEPWCNEFAGEVIVPFDWLEEELANVPGPIAVQVEHIARTFQVTPLAAAVRIARSGLAPTGAAERVITDIRSRPAPPESKPTGGGYYRNQIAWLGPGYIRLVLTALDSEAVTYPTATALLAGVKAANFAKLRDQLARSTELE